MAHFSDDSKILDRFTPVIGDWFKSNFSAPTAVQTAAWPLIAAGDHTLITAPTGSGKTLTAFLWSLDQFASGQFATGATRVLYISPLKALNNDIQRNLLEPLQQLRDSGDFPDVRVATRSGDTPQSQRQRMLRKPPEILITTPESLGLLLSTQKGHLALQTVQTIILDEIHAVVDNRRGVALMTSIERLANIAGEFQRIALSATVTPMEPIAHYVGGRTWQGQRRILKTVNASIDKNIELKVRYPEGTKEAVANGQKIWQPLTQHFKEHVAKNRSTLFFANSRQLAEKITLKINDDEPQTLAYAHHGSLARDIRTEVEHRLKAGELKAIVATNSLEMGIDIGSLDEVVLIQAPGSIASTLQRIGRAGHQVGATSRGTLYPTHANDFLEAAVLADCVARRDIEPLTPMTGSLDVLAQVIISITAFSTWSVDDLFHLVTRSGAYEDLPREQFDLLIEMLAGRYAGSRIRELKPRIVFDRIKREITALRGAVLAMYNSGGTIPDRGYYALRHIDSGAVIGELDEEFVWERKTGETFTLGTQAWQILSINHNDVLVRAAKSGSNSTPFWRSESFNRNWFFSNQIAQYLELNEDRLNNKRSEELREELIGERDFEPTAATELVEYLERQRAATNSPLPHRHHLIIEEVLAGPGGYRGSSDIRQSVIHTFWGGAVNRPWALALTAVWQRLHSTKPEIHADNNAIVVQHRGPLDFNELLTAVNPENLIPLLRQTLESSGFFGARFRECAGRSLLLTRSRFNQRLPLWMTRMQAKKLMTAIKSYSDFPVMLETWRTCLQDEFDIPTLIELLAELENGDLTWQQVTTKSPSPFAADLTFNHINNYMYADDTPEQLGQSALGEDAIALALSGVTERPRLALDTVTEFVAKRQRHAQGYEPSTEQDWAEWSKERILIPVQEWPSSNPSAAAAPGVVFVEYDSRRWVTHVELGDLIYRTLAPGALFLDSQTLQPIQAPTLDDARTSLQLTQEILSFYGPLSMPELQQLLPQVPTDLVTDAGLIVGPLLEGEDGNTDYYCDAENFEILLRFQRARRRASLPTQPLSAWPLFAAGIMSMGSALPSGPSDKIMDVIEQLRGYVAPVDVWLDDLLPARITNIPTHELDQAFSELAMTWLGKGREAITLLYPEEQGLFNNSNSPSPLAEYFVDPNARYSYTQIVDAAQTIREQLNDQWWQDVWNGQLSADTLAPLRQGQLRKYQLASNPRSSRRRRGFADQGWHGNWQLVTAPATALDALSELERQKDAARLLLERYGVLTRELANREGGNLRWAKVFKALRVMELAGEIVAGYFFEGMSGPQFATPAAVGRLQRGNLAATGFWCNATDPVSPCGMGLGWPELPTRRPGNYIGFTQGELSLILENHAKRIQILVPADHAHMDEVLAPLLHLVRLRKRVRVESINNSPSTNSDYRSVLEANFQCSHDHKHLYLEAP